MLGELRSLVPQGTPVLALTATATQQTKEMIINSLALRKDTAYIFMSPNRPNIYLHKVQVTKNVSVSFEWLIDIIKAKCTSTPKTIIYCKSQKDCGRLFCHFKTELGASAFATSEQTSCNMVIGMFHHNTLQKHKDRVFDSLFALDGICRVVFATTALGMGVNIRDVRMVIHYGPPRHIDDFIQEIGCAGRDMNPSKAILLFNGNHLRQCDESVLQYASSKNQCLRKILLQEFDNNATDLKDINSHKCCSICHTKCQCTGDSCDAEMLNVVSKQVKSNLTNQRSRKVSLEQKELLKELLTDHQGYLASQCNCYFLPPESTTGFTTELINAVVKKSKYIFNVNDLKDLVPIYKEEHAMDILFMIKDVFGDVEVNPYSAVSTVESVTFKYDLEYGGEFEVDGEFEANGSSSDSDNSLDSVLSGITGLT